MRIVN